MDTKQFYHDVAKYIQVSSAEIDRLSKVESTLLNKVASLARTVQVQKEASQHQVMLQCKPEQIAALADNVVRAGFVKEANRQDFIDNCLDNPTRLIPFLDKLATLTIQEKGLPVLGVSVEKEARYTAESGKRASDSRFDDMIASLARKTEISANRR